MVIFQVIVLCAVRNASRLRKTMFSYSSRLPEASLPSHHHCGVRNKMSAVFQLSSSDSVTSYRLCCICIHISGILILWKLQQLST
ncbi:hypothetical protein Bca101_053843 [Brassica carinata]